MKRIAVALCVSIVLISTSPAAANWETSGDSRLVVEPGICEKFSFQSRDFCGPVLSVRVPPDLSKDDATVTVSLEGPSGVVKLQYGSTATISNGRSYTDSEYWQSHSQSHTPTGLPNGEYTFTWGYLRRAQWSCSKYYERGCIRLPEVTRTYVYKFSWAGVKLETYPVTPATTQTTTTLVVAPSTTSLVVAPTTSESSPDQATSVIKLNRNNQRLRLGASLTDEMIAKRLRGGGYKYSSRDAIFLERLSGRACKVAYVDSHRQVVTALRRGECQIQVEAWKGNNAVLFHLILTVA